MFVLLLSSEYSKDERVRGMVELTTLHLYHILHCKVPKIQYLSKQYTQSYECGRVSYASSKTLPITILPEPSGSKMGFWGPVWVHMPWFAWEGMNGVKQKNTTVKQHNIQAYIYYFQEKKYLHSLSLTFTIILSHFKRQLVWNKGGNDGLGMWLVWETQEKSTEFWWENLLDKFTWKKKQKMEG